jgi:hypothetical protein
MGASNQLGIGLPQRSTRLHRLAESIPGLLKSLKIPPLAERYDNAIPTRFLASIGCSKIPALYILVPKIILFSLDNPSLYICGQY